jgi:hypothetical protein
MLWMIPLANPLELYIESFRPSTESQVSEVVSVVTQSIDTLTIRQSALRWHRTRAVYQSHNEENSAIEAPLGVE